MHTFGSQYHRSRVPYTKLAWKRIAFGGFIALFIFAMDIALITLSTSTTKDSVSVDWDFNGEIRTVTRSAYSRVGEGFNRIISIKSKSNIVEFEYPPSVVLEKHTFSQMELNESFPTFKDVPDPFFRCDTFRDWRWKVICQINTEGQTTLYDLTLETSTDLNTNGFHWNISEDGSRTEFRSKRYKKAIEDQLKIPVTSFVSTEDNFNPERPSEGQCAGYGYLGKDNSTELECFPWNGRRPWRDGFPSSAEVQNCRYEKKDCQSLIRSVADNCYKRKCTQVQSDKTNKCKKNCNESECGYSCSYMGFAMGSNSSIKTDLCTPNTHTTSSGTDHCYPAADAIITIFLHSIRIGTTDFRHRMYSVGSYPFQDEPRGDVKSQRPILPLYGLIIIYILLQLLSIILQTTVREHPISHELKFLAEVCGGSGVENLINMDLQDREVIYSQTDIRHDVISGHCGYLPGRIAGDIRQFYSDKNEIDDGAVDNTVNNIICESDMEKIIEIDGCIESNEQPKSWKLT